ncbi:MAG: hypothetical protein AB3X44_04150 [Leptothrix sp. (in: b-proteobacteria)]
MKYFLRSEQQAPRRQPEPERFTEKGRKHEAFDGGRIGCNQRSVALALRMDRKR